MKSRITIILILLGIFGAAARAQNNCCNIVPGPVQPARTTTSVPAPPGGNQSAGSYVSSETDTYVIQCVNSSTGKFCNTTPTTPNNAVTAGGFGGFTTSGTFVPCSPKFSQTTAQTDGTSFSSFTDVGTTYVGLNLTTGTCLLSAMQPSMTSQCPSPAMVGVLAECPTTTGDNPPCGTPDGPACPGRGASPIIIDLSGNGFNLTGAAGGVSFDISGTSHSVQMGWTASGANNAFLALPGADGLVHNGQQLFGDFTPQPPSENPNGFAALAVYDQPANGGNGDGVIDSRDGIFSSLRLWIDANHDGISQPEELHTLASLGVNSISLAYKADQRTDQYGNVFHYRAQVNPGDPTNTGRMAYDVFFVTLPSTSAKNLIPWRVTPANVQKCPVPPVQTKGGMLSTTGTLR